MNALHCTALHCSCNEITEIKTSSASISINNSNSIKSLASAYTKLNNLASQKPLHKLPAVNYTHAETQTTAHVSTRSR